MNEGWIKSYRKAQFHEIWKDKNAWRVFQWLIWNVDYNTGIGTFGKKQIATGTYLKESTVYKVTTRLREKYTAIATKSNNQFTEFSILRWARYQQSIQKVNALSREKETVAVAKSNTIKEYKNKEIKNNVDTDASIEYLKNLPLEDILDFSKNFTCTQTQVKEKAESLYYYCQAKGKTYKKYKAFLRNALAKDFGIRSSSGLQNAVDIIAQKEKELAEEEKNYKPFVVDYKKIIKKMPGDENIPF